MIDVVILNFNSNDLLNACVAFIRNSKKVTTNIIVVDSGSDIETLELYDNLSLRTVISKPYNYSVGSNYGASMGSAEFIAFINNDVFVDSDCLCEMLKLLNGNVGIVGCKTRFPNNTIQHFGVKFDFDKIPRHFCMGLPLDTPATLRDSEFQTITHACCLVRRKDFEKIKYDESFIFGDAEDTDFNFKLRFELGKKCIVGHKCTAIHLESATRNKFLDKRQSAFEHNYKGIFLSRWGDKIIIDD